MLKSVTVCLLLVIAVTFGWQQYEEDNAPRSVQRGTNLTWGSDGRVWGWFPVDGTNSTYITIFDPNAPEDSMWDDTTAGAVGPRVEDGAGCTFQWIEQPCFWGCGAYLNGQNWVSSLYYYYPNEDLSGTVTISEFRLGVGATIAYDPNQAYHATNYAIPGWIYCLSNDPDDESSFWRYALPGWYVPPGELLGFYPDSGAIISDLTPHLAWGNTGSAQYRVQVSTSPNFASNVVDSVVTDPDYHATTELDNGVYYWRTASWAGGQWVWGSAVHSFDLQGGWQHLADIPCDVEEGAKIAYDSGSFSTIDNYRSILALPGGGTGAFYRYKIGANTWTQLASAAGEHEAHGTCLTTRTPPEEGYPLVMARFSTQSRDDVPSMYTRQTGWTEWVVQGDDLHRSDFPRPMLHSSMVLGGGLMYMLPGGLDDARDFYRVIAPGGGDGGEGGASQVREADAHAITGYDGIEVEYQLPAAAHVRATLHDAVGRQVSQLDAGEQQSGTHRLNWTRDSEGRKLNAGAYFVLLETGTEQAKLKAVVK